MKRIFRHFLILIAIMVVSCSPRIVTVAVHDTTTVTRTLTVRDTIISAPDTISTVETSLATSTATITGGHLRHSIENKRTALSVPAKISEKQEVIRVTREIPVPVEVSKPYIPKWVWWITGWAILVTLLLAASVWLRLRV